MANNELTIDIGGIKEEPIFTDRELIDNLNKISIEQTKLKTELDSSPSYDPKNWYEQFAMYDGKLFVNINNSWVNVSDSVNYINKDGSTVYTGTGAGFKDEDDMASDSATATASQQSIKKYVDNSGGKAKFGGDGSDGALDTSSGAVNIDFDSNQVVIKNYTSINIATNNLTFTNPHTNGTLLILKSQGNVVISSTIELTGAGATKETNGFSILDVSDHFGETGANGIDDAGGTTGGDGGGAFDDNKFLYTTSDSGLFYRKFLNIVTGSGGANGGRAYSGSGNGAAGVGGRGGGGLKIECNGSLNFSGIINVDGDDGGDGGSGGGDQGGAGGGGGGSAGMAIVIYNTLTANTGTINARGGAGGDGGAGGASAGAQGGAGEGGGGAGSYSNAGGAGGRGGDESQVGTNGTNGTSSDGAGGGGGGGANGANAGGTGGTQGLTDANHYLVVLNTEY